MCGERVEATTDRYFGVISFPDFKAIGSFCFLLDTPGLSTITALFVVIGVQMIFISIATASQGPAVIHG